MERKDELTLLGNKKTVYKQDYAPEVLEERLLGAFQLSGVHQSLSDYRAAGLCGNPYQLPAGCEDGGKQES
mgnify:CR=1 FL=1